MKNNTDPLSRRILVVDDNPSIHEDFRKILCPGLSPSGATVASMVEELFGETPEPRSAAQFEMDSAHQGQEALAKVEAAEQEGRPYSLAFMDVRMPPGWDGVETISHIWKQYPHIQVVICTAYSDYSWESILRSLGETDSLVILKKPFDNVEVLQLAHALTKKWAVTRQANERMANLDESVRQRTHELVEANQKLQHEIQQRSLVESALRESEERFHKAFETVAVALAIRPMDTGRYIDVNQSFVTLSGYAKEELLGKTPEDLNLFEWAGQDEELIQSLRAGKQVRNLELKVRRKDGAFRHTMASVEVFRLGERSCLLAAMLDVSDQKQLEGQLRQAQKMEAVGQLAAGIAHDFNNLLTVIHGYSSLQLAKGALDADVAKAFMQVKLASERASSLTRQLLAFSRKQLVQRKPINLGATVSRLQGMLSHALGETVQLESDFPAALPFIHADESNIEQVIMNLALNARDAMPTGGRLSLSGSVVLVSPQEAADHPDKRPGEFIALTVADTGCGMDTQTISRIFEPFFTTKPVGRGTGLGLSTVYGIVKQHEGWVEVRSQPDQGTLFRVFLPTTEAEPDAEAPSPQPVPVQPATLAANDTILVVEDEPEVRELIALALCSEGYQVVQATTGAQALLDWPHLSGNVRLLVTDMVMPGGISGSMLAKRLRRQKPNLKVVYTSGYSAEVVGNAQRLTEGSNFLPKPFTRERLLDTVREALAAQSAGTDLVSA